MKRKKQKNNYFRRKLMDRISQEGADQIGKLINGIVDSIDKKLTAAQVKKIEDELAALMNLTIDLQDKWEKI